jgi:hypothetical protein
MRLLLLDDALEYWERMNYRDYAHVNSVLIQSIMEGGLGQ